MTDWRDDAGCRPGTGNERLPWTSPAATKSEVARMLAVCNVCPVVEKCRAELDHYGDRIGVRAGVNWTVRGSMNRRQRRAPQKPCQWCGVMFEAAPGAKHCSTACERREATLKSRRCEQCGGEFEQGARRARKFCSIECRTAAQRSWAPRTLRRERKPKVPPSVAAIGASSARTAAKRRAKSTGVHESQPRHLTLVATNVGDDKTSGGGAASTARHLADANEERRH